VILMHAEAPVGAVLRWFKSSYSGSAGSNCIEAAALPGGIAVRDSKDPDGPMLSFVAEAWSAFVADVIGEQFRP
jgi:hypothetical protein